MSFGWTTSPETTVRALYELPSLDRVLYLGSRQAMSPFQGFRCGRFSDRRGFDWAKIWLTNDLGNFKEGSMAKKDGGEIE
jgi:hypothetical protein